MGAIVLRIILWFAPCVAAWYWLAPWADAVVASGAREIIGFVASGLVREVETGARGVTFVTGILVPDRSGVMTVDVNARLYSYGLALFAAIVLGAKAGGLWWKLPAGALLVVLLAQWGVAFDVLAHLVRSAPGALRAAGVTQAGVNLIALGYQLGTLLLPPVAPAALAIALSWRAIAPLAGGKAR